MAIEHNWQSISYTPVVIATGEREGKGVILLTLGVLGNTLLDGKRRLLVTRCMGQEVGGLFSRPKATTISCCWSGHCLLRPGVDGPCVGYPAHCQNTMLSLQYEPHKS